MKSLSLIRVSSCCRPSSATVAAILSVASASIVPVSTASAQTSGAREQKRLGSPGAARDMASTPVAGDDSIRTGRADVRPGGDVIDAATREYQEKGIARTVSQGNVVAFPFGHSDPVLTCTVLRACVIELEPGELVVNEPIAGDQVRWLILPAKAGPGGKNTLVVVKPKDCDVTTNLVVPTDRRIYDLTLDSPPCKTRSMNPQQPYVRHVRFYYPDDETTSFVAAASAREAPAAGSPPERLNFDYRVKKDRRFPWKLAHVFDDGAHVYIKLPAEATKHAAPVLFALEDDGSRTLVNYAIREDVYVADRVFRRGVLVITSGAKERKVEMENQAFGRTGEQ